MGIGYRQRIMSKWGRPRDPAPCAAVASAGFTLQHENDGERPRKTWRRLPSNPKTDPATAAENC